MLLIVGLGNPGEKHAKNRHNAGYMALDQIAGRHNFGAWRKRFQGEASEGFLGQTKCLLLKPSTYMNESGWAAREAQHFYKIPLSGIVVIHDELDLKPGQIRLKTGGGNAGHNGLRSVSAQIGNDFRRIRIGIGRPENKAAVSSYVLKDFPKDAYEWLDPILEAIADAAPLLALGEDSKFISQMPRFQDESKSSAEQADGGAKPKDNKQKKTAKIDRATPADEQNGPSNALAAKLKDWLRAKE